MSDTGNIERKCSFCKAVKPLREFNKNSRAKYGYSYTCKKCRRALYLRKKEEILSQCKVYRSNNAEKISSQKRDYRERNKDRATLEVSSGSFKNCFVCKVRKTLLEFGVDRTRTDGRAHICKSCVSDYKRSSDRKNSTHKSAYVVGRLHNDLDYRLRHQLRVRHRMAISGDYKTGSAVRDLGCTVQELRDLLQLRFYVHPVLGIEMSWDNWGRGIGKWNIDHIKPLSAFDLTDPEQCAKAFHFSNLQPLWWDENSRKSNKNAA